MKSKTVKNLVISGIAFLGISYVVERYMYNKRRNLEVKENQKNKELEQEDTDVTRNYFPIGNIMKENDKFTVKQLKKVM